MSPLATRFAAVSLIVLLSVVGCGTHSAREAGRATAALPSAEVLAEQEAVGQGGAAQLTAGPIASTPQGLHRKIIYTAEIALAVEDFTGVPQRVIELVKQFDGYVADSKLTGSTGDTRHGSWTVRVPIERFEEFTTAAKGLGELVSAGTSSRDVSEEYYDVDARIRNKTKEEARLLTLLEERPGKLEDVIAMERELSRVRGELERMQGRLRVLADLTSVTTVELSIVEIRGYEPAEAPTLATRVRRSFQGSLAALRSAGELCLVAVVAMGPWLPVAAVVLCPAYFAVRRVGRTRRAPTRPATGD